MSASENGKPVPVCAAPGCPGRRALSQSRFCYLCHTDAVYRLRKGAQPLKGTVEEVYYPQRNRGEGG